ncbi:YoaK family protein [Membranihabitans marinus]|uniref:YoaK family protein n=1 Tax=Membranihabitans marinus TaxID=1227546 RepID=UPI001F4394B3|nr:YoaK family protein [Membranihabitans marinus]
MFRHQGKTRTLKHNLQIASVLSLVAGIVNVSGFLAIKQLTTNVTGHFALFIKDLTNFESWKAALYLAYIFSFLLGSFTSSLLIETFKEKKSLNVFVIPTIIECIVLISVAIISDFYLDQTIDLIACMLLFAMGLQNSYVTKISNAVVRTTHLTGLFTDLGIELSQLFFSKNYPQRDAIKSTIKLRIYIITFFFLGGIIGGYLYSGLELKLNSLIVAAIILIGSLSFDDVRYRIIISKRKYDQRRKLVEKAW